jgi:hypothetical protein
VKRLLCYGYFPWVA